MFGSSLPILTTKGWRGEWMPKSKWWMWPCPWGTYVLLVIPLNAQKPLYSFCLFANFHWLWGELRVPLTAIQSNYSHLSLWLRKPTGFRTAGQLTTHPSLSLTTAGPTPTRPQPFFPFSMSPSWWRWSRSCFSYLFITGLKLWHVARKKGIGSPLFLWM